MSTYEDNEFDVWFGDERGTGELDIEADVDEVEYDEMKDPYDSI